MISNNLTQILGLLILGSLTVTILLLWIFLSDDPSVCATKVCSPLENPNYVVVSISIDFPLNVGEIASVHCTTFDYFCANWECQ